MKRAHLVYAHPEPKSFAAAMRDTVVRVLLEQGYQVSVSDLYAIKFDPVCGPQEFSNRLDPHHLSYALEQRHAVDTGTLCPEVNREVSQVLDSELLVLVFPVFWCSVPAIMKGWIDRVFVSGRFYGGRRIYDGGPLRGKRALVVTSLGGRQHMFEGPNAIHGELNIMLRHLLQGTLAYVGFDVLQPFFAYHVPYVRDTERSIILEQLAGYIGALDTLPLLCMPTLKDFDSAFRPVVAPAQERVA